MYLEAEQHSIFLFLKVSLSSQLRVSSSLSIFGFISCLNPCPNIIAFIYHRLYTFFRFFFQKNFPSILSQISDPNFLFSDSSWFSDPATSSHPSFPDSYSFSKSLNCSNFVFLAPFQFRLHCFSYYIKISATPFFWLSLIFLTLSFLCHLLQRFFCPSSVHLPSFFCHFPVISITIFQNVHPFMTSVLLHFPPFCCMILWLLWPCLTLLVCWILDTT